MLVFIFLSKNIHLNNMEAKKKVENLIKGYLKRSGTHLHPNKEVGEAVAKGLEKNIEETGKPLCPCRFYPDKKEREETRKKRD